jgi:hypothetical protein
MKTFINIILLFFLCTPSWAGHLHHEAWYQDQWCAEQNGQTEVIVQSGARCDCLTTTHAVEFDFANKWAEAIGQSLHYAAQTGKRAGIVLIMENPAKDTKYLERLKLTIEAHDLPIDVWTTKDEL